MFLVTVIFNSTTLVAFLTRLVHFRALYNISFELKSVVSVLRMIDKCPNIFLLNLLLRNQCGAELISDCKILDWYFIRLRGVNNSALSVKMNTKFVFKVRMNMR